MTRPALDTGRLPNALRSQLLRVFLYRDMEWDQETADSSLRSRIRRCSNIPSA